MRIISGKNPVKEAIKNKIATKIYISKKLKNKDKKEFEILADRYKLKKIYVDENKLDSISESRVHQGVAVEGKDYEYSSVEESVLLAEKKGEKPFFIILDQITDVNNLGSIIRSAECAGVHGVLIPKHRSAQINETVAKTSAGALKFENPVALVIGSEGKGISRLVKENCDIILEIPMKGKINSLNASNAASILMFEVMKKRNENES